MLVKYLILAFISLLAHSKPLYQIEQRFNEIWPALNATPLPKITSQPTLQEELAQYEKLHQTRQFQHFKPDPEYSTQVLLKKNGVWGQTFYFRGRQLCNALIEVTVTHKGDNHNHDKEAISLYLLNTANFENQIVAKVKHLKLLKFQVQSELYYLRVEYNWTKQAEINVTNDEQIVKHIAISIDIDPIITSREQKQAPSNDEKAAAEKMSIITNQTDRIFMNSLEIWEQIQSHHREFFKNQEEVYLRAYSELVIVFTINCVQLVLLKRALRMKSIV